jgi:hypothetical protein
MACPSPSPGNMCRHSCSSLKAFPTWLALISAVASPLAASKPDPPSFPVPADGASGMGPSVALAWTANGAASFTVRFGKQNPPPTYAPCATSPCAVSGLTTGAIYHWQVIAHGITDNPAGNAADVADSLGSDAAGPVWSFAVGSQSANIQSADLTSLGFGIALAFRFNVLRPDLVSAASIDAAGIVHVVTRANAHPGFMLESHYLFWKNASGKFGSGPFVAAQPGTDQIIDAIGAGWMIAWKVNDSGKGFGLGFGYASIPAAQVLGAGFADGKQAPPGATSVQFQTRDKGSILIVNSFTF